ncbi:hypothetical protein Vretifemale_17159 [Volvox reticuliferus]|nr:hypothetical protein Vretifemale_17159 [Volvox reticuliferus]
MYLIQTSVFNVPWHLKVDKAFFRGIGFCSGRWAKRYGYLDACARLYLSHLTNRDREAGNATALDCGLVERWDYRVEKEGMSITDDLPVVDRVPFSHHAYFKWLLHMEGITASSRLGQLFYTNSLVIAQRSPFLEYFYRSLRPWQHYVPFWNATAPDGTPLGMDDVYGTLEELRRIDRERPHELQQIVAAANNFAIRFLSPHSRLMYYQEVLVQYKNLFPDMDSFLESYVHGLRLQGWKIP